MVVHHTCVHRSTRPLAASSRNAPPSVRAWLHYVSLSTRHQLPTLIIHHCARLLSSGSTSGVLNVVDTSFGLHNSFPRMLDESLSFCLSPSMPHQHVQTSLQVHKINLCDAIAMHHLRTVASLSSPKAYICAFNASSRVVTLCAAPTANGILSIVASGFCTFKLSSSTSGAFTPSNTPFHSTICTDLSHSSTRAIHS